MLADMSDTDLELLARYTRQHAEDAFAELVRRHLGLVYSAALRQVRSPQLAQEVTQSAFIDLARSADRLRPDTISPETTGPSGGVASRKGRVREQERFEQDHRGSRKPQSHA